MRKTVIFDLDGTVLSVNSFRVWVIYLIKARFPHLGLIARLRLSSAAVLSLAKRKAGLISHETLKWRLQKLWRTATDGGGGMVERRFVERLQRYVRPELSGLLAAVAAGEIDAVLATAAVADYAEDFGHSLGFTHILATPRHREAGEPSNLGTCKRDAVLEFLVEQGWQDRFLILFTDHIDDLPLIKLSHIVYWFGSETERQKLARTLLRTPLRPGPLGAEILQARVG